MGPLLGLLGNLPRGRARGHLSRVSNGLPIRQPGKLRNIDASVLCGGQKRIDYGLADRRRKSPGFTFGNFQRGEQFPELADLPGQTTEEGTPADWLPKLASRQHPDHDKVG